MSLIDARHKFSVETVDIEADKYLEALSTKLLFDGFLRVYHEEKKLTANSDNGESESLRNCRRAKLRLSTTDVII